MTIHKQVVDISAGTSEKIELDSDELTTYNAMVSETAAALENNAWIDARINGTGTMDADGVITKTTEGYPPIADQLDDIFHNGVAGWKKTIQAVKDAHPKPE